MRRDSGSTLYFNEEHQMLRKTVGDLIKNEINPHMDEWEQTTAPLHDIFKKMGDLGLLGIRYDPKYGGQGLDYWFETVFLEELGHIQGMGVSIAIMVQTNMATPAIAEFGSEYLKETYLRARHSGGHGGRHRRHRAGRRFRRRRPEDEGDEGRGFLRAQRVEDLHHERHAGGFPDPAGPDRRRPRPPQSFGLFVVPTDLPGFAVSKKLDKVGLQQQRHRRALLRRSRVPAENLIGEEGMGFIYQMQQFQHERFAILPAICTAATDIIAMTVDYLRQRIVFGKPLITRQVLRHRLVDWLTEIECLRQLTYHIVRMKTAGLDATREMSMGKLHRGPAHIEGRRRLPADVRGHGVHERGPDLPLLQGRPHRVHRRRGRRDHEGDPGQDRGLLAVPVPRRGGAA